MSATRILVVDDEVMVRESVRMTLAHFGYTVRTAESAAEALTLLSTETFSVVVTDWKMPGMTGDQLATQIKAQWPKLPIVLLTGHAPAGQPAGIDVLLIKPFSASDLRAAIEGLTNNKPNTRIGNSA